MGETDIIPYSIDANIFTDLFFSSPDPDACKGVTFSDCPIQYAHHLKKGIQKEAVSCQQACAYSQDCEFFRFTDNFNHKCWFLDEDYRRECNIYAAPAVSIFK